LDKNVYVVLKPDFVEVVGDNRGKGCRPVISGYVSLVVAESIVWNIDTERQGEYVLIESTTMWI
jgi:hypothetical protein